MCCNEIVEKTINLGSEHDDDLRRRPKKALEALGASKTDYSWGVVGSQVVETLDVIIGGEKLHIEAETCMGLKVSGQAESVDKVPALVLSVRPKSS